MRVLLAHKSFRVLGGAEIFFWETGAGSSKRPQNLDKRFSTYGTRTHDYRSGPYLKLRELSSAVCSFEARSAMRRLLHDSRPDVVRLFGIFSHMST